MKDNNMAAVRRQTVNATEKTVTFRPASLARIGIIPRMSCIRNQSTYSPEPCALLQKFEYLRRGGGYVVTQHVDSV
jgi:hypothetical protein